jgi:ADP-ribosylglycohydrolase
MRCIPTALAVRDPVRRIQESIDISAITHDDPRCTTACAAYNEIAALLDRRPAGRGGDRSRHRARLGNAPTASAIAYGAQLKPPCSSEPDRRS